MKLVINLVQNLDFPQNLSEYQLLDLSSSMDTSKFKSINLNDIVESDSFFSSAISKYKQFIDQVILFQDEFHDLKFTKTNLFWFTQMSEKHPIFHWLYSFFLFLQLFESNVELLKDYDKIIVFAPQNEFVKKKEFLNLFQKKIPKVDSEIIFRRKRGANTLYNLLKSTLKTIYLYLKFVSISPICNSKICNYYLIGDSKNVNKNQMYENIRSGFENHSASIKVFPLNDWAFYKKNTSYPNSLVKDKLDVLQLFGFLISCLKIFLKSNSLKSKCIELNGSLFNLDGLRSEYQGTLIYMNHFFLLLFWFDIKRNNHSRNNIFYQDELYSYGRFVSVAFGGNRSENKLFGLQHGFFNQIHTVYTLSAIEVKYGIPLPDFFIVWGEYFKNLIQEHSGLPNSFFQVLGNPAIISNSIHAKINEKNNEELKVLYCLTNLRCFKEELSIIRHYFTNNKLTIYVRLHPAKHVSKDEVLSSINDDFDFIFDESPSSSISISNSDVVISSAHSTIFIDSVINRVPIIRLHTHRYIEKITHSQLIRDVYDEHDFSKTMIAIQEEESLLKNEHFERFLELNPIYWHSFIKNLNN